MLKLFLDTCVLLPDPFWKGNYSSSILELASDKIIRLYISKVVLMELRANYELKLNECLEHLDKDISSINKIIPINLEQKFINNKDIIMKAFDQFYEDLMKKSILIELDYNNDFLDNILRRAVLKQKPFSADSKGFKDALIWFTYFNFVNNDYSTEEYGQCLNTYILCTDNVNDFYDKDNKAELHPFLRLDCNKITVLRSFKQLVDNQSDLWKVENEFKIWIERQCIEKNYIIRLCKKDFYEIISLCIKNSVLKLDPVKWGLTSFSGGAFRLVSFSIDDCDEIDTNIVGVYAIVFAVVIVNVTMETYVPLETPGFGLETVYLGNVDVKFYLALNYRLDKDNGASSFSCSVNYVDKDNVSLY